LKAPKLQQQEIDMYKYITKADKNGRIQLPVFPEIKSKKVEIIIRPLLNKSDQELIEASISSTDFWENEKDEVWNDI